MRKGTATFQPYLVKTGESYNQQVERIWKLVKSGKYKTFTQLVMDYPEAQNMKLALILKMMGA